MDRISLETLENELLSTANKICSDVKNDWATFSNVAGEAEIRTTIPRGHYDEYDGELSTEASIIIEATGQKAWILEHGKGSLMDNESENPGLADYKASDLWNSERENTEVRTRSGVYTDLDGNVQVGSGIGGKHGLNAEKLSGQAVKALPGQHIIKRNIEESVHLESLEDSLWGIGYDYVNKMIHEVK